MRDLAFKGSQEHQGGLFDQFLDLGQEGGTHGAIDHTVVTGEAEVHAQAWNDLTVFHDRFLNGRSD